MRVLVVPGDVDRCAALGRFLEQRGLAVELDRNVDCGLGRCRDRLFDLLILDVTVPQFDGFEALSQFRERSQLPVLLLTARGESGERVRGLQLGADDCLPKPFEPEELLARVHAILRRAKASPRPGASPEILEVGELKLLLGSRDAYFRGKNLRFTAMECEILECLMRSRGSVVSRDQLSLQLYHRQTSPFDRSVDTHVSRIRRKIGEGRKMILSVRGVGYQLCYPPESEP